jgi:hypothetical protein
VKVIELLKSKEWSGKVIDCVLRFALSFALALAQVFGGYAPLALGMIGASGAGLRGASALIGASALCCFCRFRTRCGPSPRAF